MLGKYNGFSGYEREKGDRILKEAIAQGVIPSPMTQPCCICGQDQGIRHYHCENYSPSLIVNNARVLCWRCHMMLHSRFRDSETTAKYFINVVIYKMKYPPVFHHDFKVLDAMRQELQQPPQRTDEPTLFDL